MYKDYVPALRAYELEERCSNIANLQTEILEKLSYLVVYEYEKFMFCEFGYLHVAYLGNCWL